MSNARAARVRRANSGTAHATPHLLLMLLAHLRGLRRRNELVHAKHAAKSHNKKDTETFLVGADAETAQ